MEEITLKERKGILEIFEYLEDGMEIKMEEEIAGEPTLFKISVDEYRELKRKLEESR